MSSSKKKVVTKCAACSCFILAKDSERHKEKCGDDPYESSVQLVSPSTILVASRQMVDKPEAYLPPDLVGWEKHNVILLHPDTLSYLEVLPRQPCIIVTDSGSHTATLWPCDQVAQLRYWHSKCTCDNLVRIVPLPESSIMSIERICLKPLSEPRNFYSSDHFMEYLDAYLSGSYVNIAETLVVPFYGQICEFGIEAPLEVGVADLNLADSGRKVPTVIRLSNKCLATVNIETTGPNDMTFADFGGATKAKTDLQTYLISPLKNNREACSIIVTGMSGCGKTLLLNIIKAQLGSMAIWIDQNRDFWEQIALLGNTNRLAVLIDDYDELKKKTDSACTQAISRLMDNNGNISVVLAIRHLDELDLSLRRRFPIEIELTVPSLPERIEILKSILCNDGITSETLIESIARETHGFTGSDLKCLCRLADFDGNKCVDRVKRFEEARKRVRPTGIRQFVLEVPDVRWEDIGGNEKLKTEIQQAVIWPQLHANAFKRFGVEPPSGILLYGPPGCSKTLVARALASQSHLNFLAVKGPELFNKWVGESERAVRELFRRARQVAPTILFFDEVDAVAVSRGEKSGSGVGDRVLAQLLTELDGLEKKSGVLVLAATNRPDTLDSALLRPGRLDRAIYVPLPDEDTRLSILRLHLNGMQIGEDVDMDELVSGTSGYSGAEIVALCRQAALIAMRENIDAEMVQRKHFL
ncbi:Spermatogenesis-associated protein 5 [Toxocara canis]|uniref:Spermatogenesis-associated protein 5 n=1 Tax=Toxocara canis TaxID=6265 RepID=A0A0B2UWW0_TOXCA|nr:Spermatogenesis-associated protein 5 [Toxocara canis]